MNGGRLQIGVFDSGFGGLTVLRALLRLIRGVDFVYLGDTARLPYGSKSQATIARYALSSTHFLIDQGADFLVIACNTASALALDDIRRSTGLPVLGVIEAGVEEAGSASHTGDILVIGTDATVGSHAYAAAARARGLRALEKACPLLVPLVEEGWVTHPVTAEVVRIYLSELFAQAQGEALQPDTLVLGCTHYPLLRGTIEASVPAEMRVIDSAESIAGKVAHILGKAAAPSDKDQDRIGHCRFFATDSVAKFQNLGARFLGMSIDKVELVDLGG
ncbi:MAG TPA: glutamate racemase [Acidobacteriaceae bacterium]|nr:glutamate racemase [Acidobacteriaceae bacterium]